MSEEEQQQIEQEEEQQQIEQQDNTHKANEEPEQNQEVQQQEQEEENIQQYEQEPLTPAQQKFETKPQKTRSFDSKQSQREKQLQSVYGNKSFQRQNSQSRMVQSQQFIRTADQFDRKIVHDQINRSQTKQLYTFAKAQRFSRPKESYCATQFYDSQVQSQLNSRSAALGFGTKSDFTKSDKYIPGPTNYNIKSVFQPIPSVKGVKFAFGRQELEKQGLLGNMQMTPGPGSYNPDGIKTSLAFSLGDRTKAKHIYLVSTTPAPGTYEIAGLHPKGQYFVGKYKGSQAAVFSPTSSHFYGPLKEKRIPGPGTYNPPGDIQNQNPYMPSNYNYQQGFQFGQDQRKTQQLPILKTPGPGAYSLPSEFGDWEYPPVPPSRNADMINSRFNKTDGFSQRK